MGGHWDTPTGTVSSANGPGDAPRKLSVLWASGAEEPPPCALSEPGVSLSTHRAPIIQPSVAHQTANAETARVASWLFLPARKPLS